VDKLYELIQSRAYLRPKIKVIGIGAGNNAAEVKAYQDTYRVPFPLFTDDDFSIHKILGQVKTPYFIGIKIHENGSHEVFYSRVGAFKEPAAFLEHVIRLSGLR